MNNWWVISTYEDGGAVLLISWIFWVIFSITMHELAHGWAALWQGDDTPRRYQRMTMNPLVHMGAQSLIMFAVIGIAWGLMPVDPSRFRWRRRGRIVVSGAGPAMNIALALITLTGAALWHRFGIDREPLHANVYLFLMTGGWLNVVLAIFNLLPIPPLDGSSILMGLSFRAYRLYQSPNAMMFGMFILLAIYLSPIGGLIFAFSGQLATGYFDAVLRVLR